MFFPVDLIFDSDEEDGNNLYDARVERRTLRDNSNIFDMPDTELVLKNTIIYC